MALCTMAAIWLLAELESNAGLWTPDSVLLHNGQISLCLSLSLSKTGSKAREFLGPGIMFSSHSNDLASQAKPFLI